MDMSSHKLLDFVVKLDLGEGREGLIFYENKTGEMIMRGFTAQDLLFKIPAWAPINQAPPAQQAQPSPPTSPAHYVSPAEAKRNAEYIKCECGSTYKKKNGYTFAKHSKTKKHQKYVAQQGLVLVEPQAQEPGQEPEAQEPEPGQKPPELEDDI